MICWLMGYVKGYEILCILVLVLDPSGMLRYEKSAV